MEAAIIKDHDVAVRQNSGVMGERYPMLGGISVAVAKAPFHRLGRFIPDEHRR